MARFKLTCKAFEIEGESITDCVLKWNKYRHNVDQYSDTLIQSIEPVCCQVEFPRKGDRAIFKPTGESVTVIGFQEARFRNWIIEPDNGSQRLCSEAALAPCALKIQVQLGDELFRFASYNQWVNKAQSWFRGLRTNYVCVDSKGRICQIGKQFMRARDEDCFPIVIYSID